MWYPRGKFTGLALIAAVFLFGANEWALGMVAADLGLVLHLVMGGSWKGFLTSVVFLLAGIGLVSIFFGSG